MGTKDRKQLNTAVLALKQASMVRTFAAASEAQKRGELTVIRRPKAVVGSASKPSLHLFLR